MEQYDFTVEVKYDDRQWRRDDLCMFGCLRRGSKNAYMIIIQCMCQFILWPGDEAGFVFKTKIRPKKICITAGALFLLWWTVLPQLPGYRTGTVYRVMCSVYPDGFGHNYWKELLYSNVNFLPTGWPWDLKQVTRR